MNSRPCSPSVTLEGSIHNKPSLLFLYRPTCKLRSSTAKQRAPPVSLWLSLLPHHLPCILWLLTKGSLQGSGVDPPSHLPRNSFQQASVLETQSQKKSTDVPPFIHRDKRQHFSDTVIPVGTGGHRSQHTHQSVQHTPPKPSTCGVWPKVDEDFDSTAEGR